MKLLLLVFTLGLAMGEEAKAPPAVPIMEPDALKSENLNLKFQLAQKDFQAAQTDLTLLELRLCSEAGWKRGECNVDWQKRLVTKVMPPKFAPPAKPPEKPKEDPKPAAAK